VKKKRTTVNKQQAKGNDDADAAPVFSIGNGLGDGIDDPTPEQMRAFLFNVDATDVEHGAAWLTIEETETALEWNGDGRLVFYVNGGDPRHVSNVSRERALALWQVLTTGDIDAIEREPWLAGNGYVRSVEEEKAFADAARERGRAFYDMLGEERSVPCRHEGCKRGAITHSVFCRVHHYEAIWARPCPFDH
jgi:hypothetical protein